jgi:tetratricopeptide (TPR) repeat protein
MGVGTGFAGRPGELVRFERALAGETRLLLVVGDAGVGKTRFVTEALRAAAVNGMIVAWGGCLPLAEKLPLLPVAQALGALSHLAGGRLLGGEVFLRAEGNPFFTEQLVSAALAEVGEHSATVCTDGGPDVVARSVAVGAGGPGDAGGLRGVPSALPVRLAELLLARSRRCGPDGQAVLAALSVAGRPLDEWALGDVTGRDRAAVRRGLRELAAARLLADPGIGPAVGSVARLVAGEAGQARNGGPTGVSRPRHALLAEAVAGALPPGERVELHERTAAAFESAGNEDLAAEAAGHWLAAGRLDREFLARVAAGRAAERVFGYAGAAAHFQRAIALCRERPDLVDLLTAGSPSGTGPPGTSPPETDPRGLPELYVRAVDALEIAGDSERAGMLAEEAHARFATHPEPALAAMVIMRAADFQMRSRPEAALRLLQEAIGLVSDGPPSAVQAEAYYAARRPGSGVASDPGGPGHHRRPGGLVPCAGLRAIGHG